MAIEQSSDRYALYVDDISNEMRCLFEIMLDRDYSMGRIGIDPYSISV